MYTLRRFRPPKNPRRHPWPTGVSQQVRGRRSNLTSSKTRLVQFPRRPSLPSERIQFRLFLSLLSWNLQNLRPTQPLPQSRTGLAKFPNIGAGIDRVRLWPRSRAVPPRPSNVAGMPSPIRLSTMLVLYASPCFRSTKNKPRRPWPSTVLRLRGGRKWALTSLRTFLQQSPNGSRLPSKRNQVRRCLHLLP